VWTRSTASASAWIARALPSCTDELTVCGAGSIEILAAFFELETQIGHVLFEMGDLNKGIYSKPSLSGKILKLLLARRAPNRLTGRSRLGKLLGISSSEVRALPNLR
jgi:hypothetical protein